MCSYAPCAGIAIFTGPVDDQLRVYPNGSLAAHVLGFAATDETQINGRQVFQPTGRDGIELSLNSALSGVPGWRVTEMIADVRNWLHCGIRMCSRATAIMWF